MVISLTRPTKSSAEKNHHFIDQILERSLADLDFTLGELRAQADKAGVTVLAHEFVFKDSALVEPGVIGIGETRSLQDAIDTRSPEDYAFWTKVMYGY